MNKRMIVLAGGMMIGGLSLGLLFAAGPQAPQPTKWEYKHFDDGENSQLNDNGNEGWELVSVVAIQPNGMYSYYMKRPKQ